MNKYSVNSLDSFQTQTVSFHWIVLEFNLDEQRDPLFGQNSLQ